MPRNARPVRRGMAPIVTSGVLVCLAVALGLLGHIRLKAELNRLYSGISRLDREILEVRRTNQRLEVDLATLTSPDGLGTRLRKLRLDLVMPGDDARVVLPEPAEEPRVEVMLGGVSSIARENRLAGGTVRGFDGDRPGVR